MSMVGRPSRLLTWMCLGAAALLLHAPDARAQGGAAAGASASSDTVHVAAPTGEEATDRASILAALGEVEPGGTVQFAPGTYLVGEVIQAGTRGVTLLGHAEGTTLRGCDPAELEELEREAARAGDLPTRIAIVRRCGMLELTGGRWTVRDLTFEYTRMGLILGCCHGDLVLRSTDGGYHIEGNTFRHSGNAIRAGLLSSDTTVIRGNRFVNTYHALSALASHLRVLDNDISATEQARVTFAISLESMPPWHDPVSTPAATSCEHNLIARNRIEGYPEGITVVAYPGRSCRKNVIRDNIIVTRNRHQDDSTWVGVPLILENSPPAGGQREQGGEAGTFEDNLIEGNRIIGAEGLGMLVYQASRTHIVNNTITGVRLRDPFPGHTLGFFDERWREANGSGIWVSPGSDGNEIVGNAFEDVAAAAVVLEGDSNRVELRSASDSVRDLGRANHVHVATTAARQAAEEVRARTNDFLAALSDDSPTFVSPFYAADAVLVLPEGTVLEGREAIVRGFLRPRVPPLRGVRALSEELVGGGDTITWKGAIAARVAPAADTVRGALSATWARQPDGEWRIAASTVDLPDPDGEPQSDPVRSGFFQSAGARLHYLDFGGVGVPTVFMPNRDRTAYTFIDFAPRFTDRNRVLAVTSRGTGESGGEWDSAPDIAALGRDVIALLDTLGLERAVVAHAWAEVLVYLAEQHPGRVAGLVFLGGRPQPALPALWDADTTGILEMVPRLAASWDGADPDEAMRLLRERWYPAQHLRVDRAIDIPALVFLNESEASSGEDRWEMDLQYARWVAAGELAVPDSATRAYFLRLASDEAAQAEVRAVYRDLVAPAHHAANERFRRAFGEHLRVIPLEERATGYGYREAPELIAPHIRRFLDEVSEREQRSSRSPTRR